MFRQDDLEYFERRRVECLQRADAATEPDIARLHRTFAAHYTRAIEEMNRSERWRAGLDR